MTTLTDRKQVVIGRAEKPSIWSEFRAFIAGVHLGIIFDSFTMLSVFDEAVTLGDLGILGDRSRLCFILVLSM